MKLGQVDVQMAPSWLRWLPQMAPSDGSRGTDCGAAGRRAAAALLLKRGSSGCASRRTVFFLSRSEVSTLTLPRPTTRAGSAAARQQLRASAPCLSVPLCCCSSACSSASARGDGGDSSSALLTLWRERQLQAAWPTWRRQGGSSGGSVSCMAAVEAAARACALPAHALMHASSGSHVYAASTGCRVAVYSPDTCPAPSSSACACVVFFGRFRGFSSRHRWFLWCRLSFFHNYTCDAMCKKPYRTVTRYSHRLTCASL